MQILSLDFMNLIYCIFGFNSDLTKNKYVVINIQALITTNIKNHYLKQNVIILIQD